jgi:hypothetical protein
MCACDCIKRPSPKHYLYAVYHHHKYGSSQWLVWADAFPNEEQIIESLEIDFEPEKDEFIEIERIERIDILTLT